MTVTVEEELELILYEEIEKELNRQIILKLKDPSYVMESSPATFDSEETKQDWMDRSEEIAKIMKERRRQLNEERKDGW